MNHLFLPFHSPWYNIYIYTYRYIVYYITQNIYRMTKKPLCFIYWNQFWESFLFSRNWTILLTFIVSRNFALKHFGNPASQLFFLIFTQYSASPYCLAFTLWPFIFASIKKMLQYILGHKSISVRFLGGISGLKSYLFLISLVISRLFSRRASPVYTNNIWEYMLHPTALLVTREVFANLMVKENDLKSFLSVGSTEDLLPCRLWSLRDPIIL